MSTTMQNSRAKNRHRQPGSGRGGYPSYKRENSESEPSNSSPIRGLYRDARTAMMMCSVMGTCTSVKTRNGSTYKGHTMAFSEMGDIALTDAKLEDDDNNQNPILPGLIIPKNNFVVCKTNGVDLKGLCSSSTDFTDSGIVGRMNGSSETQLRELQPWHDDDALDVNSALSLDDANDGWDSHSMFQANRDKFNVQTSYSEDLHEYTTKLPEPGSEGYEERERFAQKQAEEIEQSEAYQNRIAKELGNGDEEDQFSAVHRPGEGNVPQRTHESNNGGSRNVYTILPIRTENEQSIKNGTLKGSGRGVRPSSSYGPAPGHSQQHQSLQQNSRQMNNHYQGPPLPAAGPVNKNQGPPGSIHPRQHGSQSHAGHPYPHHPQQYQQHPPPAHPGMHHQAAIPQHPPSGSQHQPVVSQHPTLSQQQAQQQPPISHQSPVSHHPIMSHQPPMSQHHQPPLPQQHPPAPISQQPPNSQHPSPVAQQQQPQVSQHHQPPVSSQPPIPQHHQAALSQHHNPLPQQLPQHQRPTSQQLTNPGSQNISKPQPPHPHPQTMPSTLSSMSQQPPPQHPTHPQRVSPPQAQHPPLPQRVSPPVVQHTTHPQRVSPPHSQVPQSIALGKPTNFNGPPGSHPQISNHPYRQVNTEVKLIPDGICQKVLPIEVTAQTYHQKQSGHQAGPNSMSGHNVSVSSSSCPADTQQMGPAGTNSPSASLADRRIGHGADTGPEDRHKIGRSLHDFKRNFVLESNGVSLQESSRSVDTADPVTGSSSPASSSVASTPVNTEPEVVAQLADQSADVPVRRVDKVEENIPQAPKSKLNPNAKEFKPKTPAAPLEAQSPSPQPGTSPLMPPMVHYPTQPTVLMHYPSYIMTNQLNPQRKRATVSLGAGVVSEMAAHQVTGQPLLATQPPSGMMYISTPTQALPAGYQFYSPQIINPRMVAPASLAMAQTGQISGLEQSAAHNQPQPVFMTAQQSVPAPIPAHLHHQPTHAQAISLPSSNQQVQPAHIPNPAPSPVQQHNSQSIQQQQHPHHMSQGPSQSATPQPAHYPQMTISYNQTVPRTSISGHSSMGFMSAPQFAYNGNATQYTFATAPQTPQPSSHGSAPHYVVMPQPAPQGHPAIQQHTGQPYTAAGIPYQPQHIMQGPPQMPSSHNPNHNQGSPHLIHPAIPAGMHQQVSAAQPAGMYMPVPSTLQYHQQ